MMRRIKRLLAKACTTHLLWTLYFIVGVNALVGQLFGGPHPMTQSNGSPVVQAWVQFVYYAVMIIAAVYAYSQRPKPKTPEPQKARVPVVKDGKPIGVIFGDVWIDDSNILGMKEERQVPIKGASK